MVWAYPLTFCAFGSPGRRGGAPAIWRLRGGGEAARNRSSFGKPPLSRDFGSAADWAVPDVSWRHQACGLGNVKRRPRPGADAGQVAGIAAVVATKDQHQV